MLLKSLIFISELLVTGIVTRIFLKYSAISGYFSRIVLAIYSIPKLISFSDSITSVMYSTRMLLLQLNFHPHANYLTAFLLRPSLAEARRDKTFY